MMGNEISPMEITAAATTPVVAASNAPTKTTATAKPPRTGPNTWATVSSRSSAMRLRSKIIPIKVKNGMASSVSLDMMPTTRNGSAWNNTSGNRPISIPRKPNARPVAANENATGKPMIKKHNKPANNTGTKFACKNSIMMLTQPLLQQRLHRLQGCCAPARQGRLRTKS